MKWLNFDVSYVFVLACVLSLILAPHKAMEPAEPDSGTKPNGNDRDWVIESFMLENSSYTPVHIGDSAPVVHQALFLNMDQGQVVSYFTTCRELLSFFRNNDHRAAVLARGRGDELREAIITRMGARQDELIAKLDARLCEFRNLPMNRDAEADARPPTPTTSDLIILLNVITSIEKELPQEQRKAIWTRLEIDNTMESQNGEVLSKKVILSPELLLIKKIELLKWFFPYLYLANNRDDIISLDYLQLLVKGWKAFIDDFPLEYLDWTMSEEMLAFFHPFIGYHQTRFLSSLWSSRKLISRDNLLLLFERLHFAFDRELFGDAFWNSLGNSINRDFPLPECIEKLDWSTDTSPSSDIRVFVFVLSCDVTCERLLRFLELLPSNSFVHLPIGQLFNRQSNTNRANWTLAFLKGFRQRLAALYMTLKMGNGDWDRLIHFEQLLRILLIHFPPDFKPSFIQEIPGLNCYYAQLSYAFRCFGYSSSKQLFLDLYAKYRFSYLKGMSPEMADEDFEEIQCLTLLENNFSGKYFFPQNSRGSYKVMEYLKKLERNPAPSQRVLDYISAMVYPSSDLRFYQERFPSSPFLPLLGEDSLQAGLHSWYPFEVFFWPRVDVPWDKTPPHLSLRAGVREQLSDFQMMKSLLDPFHFNAQLVLLFWDPHANDWADSAACQVFTYQPYSASTPSSFKQYSDLHRLFSFPRESALFAACKTDLQMAIKDFLFKSIPAKHHSEDALFRKSPLDLDEFHITDLIYKRLLKLDDPSTRDVDMKRLVFLMKKSAKLTRQKKGNPRAAIEHMLKGRNLALWNELVSLEKSYSSAE